MNTQHRPCSIRQEQLRKLTIAAGAIILALLLGWLTFTATSTEAARDEASRIEVRSLNVLIATNAVLRAAEDAEASQRGYLLTGDDRFLDGLQRGRAALPAAVAELRMQAQGFGVPQSTLEHIEDLTDERIRQLERSIDAKRQGLFPTTRLSEHLQIGKRTMDALRKEMSTIETAQRQALLAGQDRAQRLEQQADRWRALITAMTIILCTACSFLILGMFRAWRISREQRLLAEGTVALKHGQHLLQSIIDASGDAIFVKDREGRVLYVNKQLEKLVGKPIEQLHGMLLPPATDPQEAESLAEADRAAFEFGERRTVEEHLVVEGSRRAFHTDKIPWIRDGAIEGVIGIVRDVTDIKAREEELEHRVDARTEQLARAVESAQHEMAEREAAEEAVRHMQRIESLGKLTGGIAHDFNNMLAVVSGSLELARRKLPADAEPALGPLIDNAREGAARAADLTARLLAFARQQPLKPQPVAINELIAQTHKLLAHTLGGNIDVRLDLDPRAGWTEVDVGQFESALVNLAVNARDAMPGGGRLTIATQRKNGNVLISLTDTGAGMPPESAARAFEPFYTTKELGRGTGLGLSQVHGFVVQSGGKIELDSTLGIGTTVRICLRASKPPALVAPVGHKCEAQARGCGETVLLVEDEGLVRISAQASLESLGYRVIAVADGAEALTALDENPEVSLMISDIAMPGMNGRELAEAARKRRPGLGVLLTTGYEQRRPANENTPVLAKPYMLEELASAIGEVLG